MVSIGDKVKVSDCHYYDGDGKIIKETPCFWIVKITVHRTMGEVYGEQKEEIRYFHKKNNLSKGFSKFINTGDFLQLSFNKNMVQIHNYIFAFIIWIASGIYFLKGTGLYGQNIKSFIMFDLIWYLLIGAIELTLSYFLLKWTLEYTKKSLDKQ